MMRKSRGGLAGCLDIVYERRIMCEDVVGMYRITHVEYHTCFHSDKFILIA